MSQPVDARTLNALPDQLVARRHCGAVMRLDGTVRWRVWAPGFPEVRLVLIDGDGRDIVSMRPELDGHFVHTQSDVRFAQQYAYCFDGFECRPDPCSLWQPLGSNGTSTLYCPERFAWTDQRWLGVPRSDLVAYEIDVANFTSHGTFEAAISRLDTLKQSGFTAIRLLQPCDTSAGKSGCPFPYAARSDFGGPRSLQLLIDAAHARGIAVLLDLPDNDQHAFERLGEGRRLSLHAQRLLLDGARMWLEEFHLDGVQLKTTPTIEGLSTSPLSRDLQQVAFEVQARTGRHVHILGEAALRFQERLTPAANLFPPRYLAS